MLIKLSPLYQMFKKGHCSRECAKQLLSIIYLWTGHRTISGPGYLLSLSWCYLVTTTYVSPFRGWLPLDIPCYIRLFKRKIQGIQMEFESPIKWDKCVPILMNAYLALALLKVFFRCSMAHSFPSPKVDESDVVTYIIVVHMILRFGH